MEIFKARLVANGFTQKEGIDNEETFSPVAMPKSIRILLSIAAMLDYEFWQMDVKTVFLTGILKKTSTCSNHMGSYKRIRTHGM